MNVPDRGQPRKLSGRLQSKMKQQLNFRRRRRIYLASPAPPAWNSLRLGEERPIHHWTLAAPPRVVRVYSCQFVVKSEQEQEADGDVTEGNEGNEGFDFSTHHLCFLCCLLFNFFCLRGRFSERSRWKPSDRECANQPPLP